MVSNLYGEFVSSDRIQALEEVETRVFEHCRDAILPDEVPSNGSSRCALNLIV